MSSQFTKGTMSSFTYFALFVLVALNSDTSARRLLDSLESKNVKIVGGTEVSIQQFPYMAFILLYDGRNYYECGGSIISRRYILTAAHCVDGIISATMRIGSSRDLSGGKVYNSSRLMRHELFNPRTLDYDVAVIRTSTRMDLEETGASTISLISGGQRISPGTAVNITGWGDIREGVSGNGRLMGTVVHTYSNAECRELLGSGTITERMICMGEDEGGRDTCQGDSGGPAVANGLQIGIVSGGFGCARPDTPGFYTNITNPAIRNWINRNTSL